MRTKYHPTFKSDYDKGSVWFLSSAILFAAWVIVFAMLAEVVSPQEKNIAGIITSFFLVVVVFLFFARGNKLKKANCAHCYQELSIKEPIRTGGSYTAKCSPCRIIWDLKVKKNNYQSNDDDIYHDH